MRAIAAAVAGWIFTAGALSAQNPPPASDNPLAGLNLSGSDAPAAAAPDAPVTFMGKFAGHLVVLNGDHFKPADPGLLDGVKYVAFYYSASWCGPCRQFTPKLVDFYNSFKRTHANFELIFVNDDDSANDMLAYMVADHMPWPAVRFDDITSQRLKVKHYQGPGIPCLVLVDESGKVLSDSYVNGEYVGPYVVMDAISQKLPPAQATASAGP